MTDRTDELCTRLRISRVEVEQWVAAGWVRPAGDVPESKTDEARLRLVADLRREMGIDNEAIPVILSLIDQVHGLRRQLRRVGEAIEAQPDSVRRRIVAALDQRKA